MVWTVTGGFLLALTAPWLNRVLPRAASWLLGMGALALATYFLARSGEIATGTAVVESYDWVPALGLELSFRLDGLSVLFALLICGVGGLIFIYTGGYLANHAHLGRILGFLALFMASMLGLVLSDSLLLIFIFWELTSISSYFLIGFDYQAENARHSALQALLVTGVGGVFLLIGFLLLGQIAGSHNLGDLFGMKEAVSAHSLYLPVMLLISLGAFTKSAQFPFHFWLPSAMVAPTPVSAYLHSVTMVKAGIYLLLRFSPILGGTAEWSLLLWSVGGVTMLAGVWLAVQQVDLKRILAFTTISSLGTMVFLIGLDTSLAIQAAIVYLFAHAFYKGSLFMVAGYVDHAVGSRDISRLGGLAKKLPWLGAAAVAAGLSMAGAPPFIGFFAKEMFYQTAWADSPVAIFGVIIAVAASILMVAAAGLASAGPFLGPLKGNCAKAHSGPLSLALGPFVLAGLGLAAGVFPSFPEGRLLAPAAGAVLNSSLDMDLKLWHGWTPVLGLSVLTLASGVGIYFCRGWLRALPGRWQAAASLGPARWYEAGLDLMNGVAAWQTRVLQNGRLRLYMITIVAATVLLVFFVLGSRTGLDLDIHAQPVFLRDLVLGGVILAAAWITIRTGKRLAAVVAMGVIGYGIALIYVQFGAPDLAMTQFIIETMTVVLFVLIIHRLPLFSRIREKRTWWLDASVALAAGGLMTILSLVALAVQEGSKLAGFFADHSLTDGHGRNIVNVILVDFRALDTLGEITVLALAGVGVLALLKLSVD